MSWTTEWMRDWLNAGVSKRTQAELASLAGIDPANVSRWLRSQAKPDQESIDRIAARVDPSEGASLVTAWLRDHTPPHLTKRELQPGKANGAHVTQNFPEGMSQDLRDRLMFFGQLAMANPDIRQIIDVCYEAAKRSGKLPEPKPPLPSPKKERVEETSGKPS